MLTNDFKKKKSGTLFSDERLNEKKTIEKKNIIVTLSYTVTNKHVLCARKLCAIVKGSAHLITVARITKR
jgi:hypothetical protein